MAHLFLSSVLLFDLKVGGLRPEPGFRRTNLVWGFFCQEVLERVAHLFSFISFVVRSESRGLRPEPGFRRTNLAASSTMARLLRSGWRSEGSRLRARSIAPPFDDECQSLTYDPAVAMRDVTEFFLRLAIGRFLVCEWKRLMSYKATPDFTAYCSGSNRVPHGRVT